MKKLLLLLAIVTLAACGEKNSKNSSTIIDSLNTADTIKASADSSIVIDTLN